MDKLKQMTAFVEAVDQGSLARAALAQQVTPVMLGRRIDALERRLGVKLLHRTTRHLALTEPGTVFLEHARRLLADLEVAETIVADGQMDASGHLIVSAPAAFGRLHVAPHAPAFLAQHPKVRISFNLTDQVVDLVREGYELGIRIGGTPDPSSVAVRLAANRRVVCATPDYLARCGTPRTLDDLAHHNCLAFNLQGGQRRGWYFQRDGKTVTIKVTGTLDCNDGQLLHRWVSEGLGLAWRSTWEIESQLASGELVTVLDDHAMPNYDILAVYMPQRHVPARVRAFIETLKGAYARPGYWTRGPGAGQDR